MELSDIMDATNKLADWYTLGVHLKLPTEELDDIERRLSSQGLKRCKIELFRLWKQRERNASWEHLALALIKCGEMALAGQIRARRSQTSLTAATADSRLSKASELQPEVHMTSKTGSSLAKTFHQAMTVGKREMKRLMELERAYALLISELQTALEEEKVSLIKLKRFLQHLLCNDDVDLSKAGSVDELFHMIEPHHSFINITIPEKIILEFVEESLKPKLEEYKKQLKEIQAIFKMAESLGKFTIKRFKKLVQSLDALPDANHTQTGNDKTALIDAARSGSKKGVEVLLNAGADINVQDSEGTTALHAAASEGDFTITELLLASGAQTSITDDNDNTPLDLALDGAHDDVCQLLIAHTLSLSDPQTSAAST